LAAASDAGPLIWLGKCGLLHLLKKLYHEIVIPEAVHAEAVTRGLEKGYGDAHVIKKAIAEGWIKIHKSKKQFTDKVWDRAKKLGVELGRGEREAIALALEKEIPSFLTNDEDAYQIGTSLDLKPTGILYVLLRSVKGGYLNKRRAKESLRLMLEEGVWLSPLLVNKFHEALDRLEKNPGSFDSNGSS